ncbi:glycosyltransferase [Algoriphagus sp. SE2]
MISVIIPVYKDWSRLLLCLEALEYQKNTKSKFEVIVINNDPEDLYVPENSFSYPVYFLRESIPGSYAARNKGLSKAKGIAILFTDSDCIPANDWISQAERLINETEADLIAGSIKLFSKEENKFVHFERTFAFPNEKYVKDQNFGVTANLLVRKPVIDKIGGFNEKLLTGGDSEFCNRAVNEGFKIEFHEELKVSHPARSSWKELKLKAIRFGGRLPNDKNRYVKFLKVLGKFRIRLDDIQEIVSLEKPSLKQKFDLFFINQSLRWVEAKESLFVFFGKKAGRK